eukprot:2455644-Prymnesium_polylepis.1
MRAGSDAITAAMACDPAHLAVQRWGCVALCSAAGGEQLQSEAATRALGALGTALRAHPSDALVQEQGCGAVWGLVAAHPAAHPAAAKAGCVPPL